MLPSISALHVPIERRQRKAKVSIDGAAGDADELGDRGIGQPRELSKHDDFGGSRMVALEAIKGRVEREEIPSRQVQRDGRGDVVVEGDARAGAAVLDARLAPGRVDEQVSHRASRGAEEVGPPIPARVLVADEPHVGVVDQRGRLERLARGRTASLAWARVRSSS